MVAYRSYLRCALGSLLSSLAIVSTALPSLAAERVVLSYGSLEIAVSIDSLEAFAREGQVNDDLDSYLRNTSIEEREELQAILLAPVEVSPATLSRFLYSASGEVLLHYLGNLIQTDSRLNGFYALRAAVVLAAADAEGLTLLNVLQQFPTTTVRLDGLQALRVAGAAGQLVEQTEQAIALIEQQSALEIRTAAAVDFTEYADLEQPGSFSWQSEFWNLYDQRRDRAVTAELYQPRASPAEPVPVVVISHGLGADRSSFTDLAQHLASHGFGVILLDNPGISNQQLQSLLRGTAREVVDPEEFINIPQDVSFLLDELDRLNQVDSSQSVRFNLQQVGMIGHSFGGYTALALAGAEFDFEQLQTACTFNTNGPDLVNFSLLLQCTALQLENTAFQSLQDERIQAVFTMNAIGSGLFGPQGMRQLQVPALLVAGSDDPLAPALLEQIRPFAWLEGNDKYLMVIQGGTHIYGALDASTYDTLALPEGLEGPDPLLARQYFKASGLAFMQTYIADHDEYRPYLSASYIQTISRPPLELSFIRALSSADSISWLKR
ncbi:alpha/beta fold hydrolase [Oscillatoria sp. CS-180]|uniref:alpha/beta hydrolase n=1 Tax=Oscillatoria sp. CS-180 TaxID=3021720 RepID=UPI00232D1B43|nr:alpha/beta hydrolase [Oscillatoria sp. CS-180]MDB9528495.1 alpha/beta fold hydrolase [Oscillatoria sp. CS-180]